jgi:hypothetical protein
MITVRSAAERAFGPIPEGATIHIGHSYNTHNPEFGGFVESAYLTPIMVVNGEWPRELARTHSCHEFPIGPDISNEPCIPFFREIFGAEFDAAVKELEGEGK